MKTCRNKNCSQPNPQSPSKFNKRRGIDDGLQPYCRTCQSQSNSRQRERRHRPRQPWKNNPEMYNAYRRLRDRVRKKQVTRGPCKECGTDVNVCAYLKDKDAQPRWYCRFHHPNRAGNPVDPEVKVSDD